MSHFPPNYKILNYLDTASFAFLYDITIFLKIIIIIIINLLIYIEKLFW